MDRNEHDGQKEHNWEILKLYFEFFKHFTTFNAAIALVVLALSRTMGLSPKAAVGILILLGVNLLLSLWGIYVVMFRANVWGYSPEPGSLPFVLMVATIIAFFIGLVVIGIASIPPAPPGSSSGCVFPDPFC